MRAVTRTTRLDERWRTHIQNEAPGSRNRDADYPRNISPHFFAFYWVRPNFIKMDDTIAVMIERKGPPIEKIYPEGTSLEEVLYDAKQDRARRVARGDNNPVLVGKMGGPPIAVTEITTVEDISNPERRANLETRLRELTGKWLTTLPTAELAQLMEQLERIEKKSD